MILPSGKTIRELLATAQVPLPPTAVHMNVQRGLLGAMGAYNAADQVIKNYETNTTTEAVPMPATPEIKRSD